MAEQTKAKKDDLAARRAQAELDKDPSRKNGGDPADDGGDDEGQSIEDLANGAGEEHGEEDDGQLFVMEQGRKVTLSSLIARNTPTTYEVKLTGRALKGPGSLIAFSDPDVTLVALCRAGKVTTEPTYNEDGTVKSVHVQQEIKTRTFYDARTEAAQVALRGE